MVAPDLPVAGVYNLAEPVHPVSEMCNQAAPDLQAFEAGTLAEQEQPVSEGRNLAALGQRDSEEP
jgi:hypothetical protein